MRKKDLIERVRQLEFKIDMMQGDISQHDRKIKRLECPHKKIEFVRGDIPVCGIRQCNDCGKILRQYDNELEFKEAQMEYYRQKANEIETGEQK